MNDSPLPINQIVQGDCIETLQQFPPGSIDLIFADPPYNLQLNGDLWRPNHTRVDAVADEWDHFDSFQAYDDFTRSWLQACRRVLKDDGSIWVIGTYHNIFRVGKVMQDLGFWLLNDVVWIKTNPMPNFRGVRLANAQETLIWASRSKGSRYTFNHHAMKALNGGKQMRSDWVLPRCSGEERLKVDGRKAHSTQKPEALLYRVILASSRPGDLILDPFFGTGTTGAVARKLHRRWIGIERQPEYIELARQRIERIQPEPYTEQVFDLHDQRRLAPRVPFARLLEAGLVRAGQQLIFQGNPQQSARVRADGSLILFDGFTGSIHQASRHLLSGSPANGWTLWHYIATDGSIHPLDDLRAVYRQAAYSPDSDNK